MDIRRKLTKTHGGRILLTAIPVGVVMAVMGAGVAQGAVPVSFSISGTQFQVGASLLEAGRVVLSGSSAELRADDSVRRSYLGY